MRTKELPTATPQASSLERRMRGVRLELIAVLAVTVLPLIFTSARNALAQETALVRTDLTAGTLFSVLHCFIGLLLVAYVAYQRGDSLGHFGWRIRLAVIPGSLAVFAMAIAGYAVFYLLVNPAGLSDSQWPGRSQHEPIREGAGGILLLMAVVSPVFEETVVRGYLMTRLRDLRLGAVWCVLGSTVVQASYHVHKGLMLIPAYTAIFLVFSLCFARYRNLPVVILAHLYIDIIWWAIG